MNRVINACDKSLRARPANALILAANVAQDILPDVTKQAGEFAHRSIQNVGNNPVYIAIGQDVDKVEGYHKVLQSGQELDCSFHCQRVSAISAVGTTIAVLVMTREDMTTHQTIIQ